MRSRPPILWVGAQYTREELTEALRPLGEVLSTSTAELTRRLAQSPASLLVFDYDCPETGELQALEAARRQAPALPVVMLVAHGSEALAIWALRLGVRDYLPRPFTACELRTRIEHLLRTGVPPAVPPDLPSERVPGSRVAREAQAPRTAAALRYIEDNLAGKITLEETARCCGLNSFTFCRAFRQEHGISLQRFVVRSRIERARTLLRGTSDPITAIAYAVGFNDLSYFGRAFRQHTGVSPSAYRHLTRTRAR